MKELGKKIYISIAAVIASFLLATILSCEISFAAGGAIDTSRQGSLTIAHISVDEEKMAGVVSHIYLVATIDENGKYTITDEFKGLFSNQDFFNNEFNYDSWKSCVDYDNITDSDKLLDYIDQNSIAPTAESISDADGNTCYTGLTLGVYYVQSDKVKNEDYIHSFANFVYPVPLLEYDDNAGKIVANYTPSVLPKKSKAENTDVHCHVRKVWNDSGNTDKRPSSVTFNIYSNGVLMETVTLSDENDWSFEWSEDGDHTYTIEEVSPGNGYTSSMVVYQDGHHFYYTCTNTYNSPTPPPDTPDTPGTPDTPDTPGIPDLPEVLGAIRDLPQVLGARRLPQTGQLWWPLPILVIAGVFMIVKGIRKNSKNA